MVLELPIVVTLAIGTLVTWLLLRAAQAVKWASASTQKLHTRVANGIKIRPHGSVPAVQNETR